MKKLHVAISTNNIEASVKEYSERLSCEPCSIVKGEYALWRTETVNFSIRYDLESPCGSLRHMGWEDSEVNKFTQDTDINGVIWESFNAQNQAEEINTIWPQAKYKPRN